MSTDLHPRILEHARHLAQSRGILLSAAINRLIELRPPYFRELPLLAKPRERCPPFAVTPHLVRTLKAEAKKLRNKELIQHATALDRVAFHSGFHDWKHVMKMTNNFELTVSTPIESGFVFALWYPENSWCVKKWDPKSLAPFGFIHDPRILFSAAENLKNCYVGEDADGGSYVLGFSRENDDGSIEWNTKTEVFLEELQVDVYVENNLPDLHFFRYEGRNDPTSLDEARTLLETALGPVRWHIQEQSFPPEPVSLSVHIDLAHNTSDMPSSDLPQTLPSIGDRSNIHLHIPIVHYVWFKGVFVELDHYNF